MAHEPLLAVSLHIRQVLGDGNGSGKDGDEGSDEENGRAARQTGRLCWGVRRRGRGGWGVRGVV